MCCRPSFEWLLSFSLLLAAGSGDAQDLTLEFVVGGLSRPVYMTAPEGDLRLFIVQSGGLIRIVEDGTLLATPFLDISGLIPNLGGNDERGLLGLAFPPNYATAGCFFVYFTNGNAGNRVEIVRYRVSGEPNLADSQSGELLVAADQPFPNHNGGQIQFRPLMPSDPVDGPFWLYAGLGDGGSRDDPGDRAQDDSSRLGKMLRYPVSCDSDLPMLPDSSQPPAVGEIWSKGLRNPYRWSFDRETGDLYIGDVGQTRWEEINVERADSSGGVNYGWRDFEGSECNMNPLMGRPADCQLPGVTFPVYEYAHPAVGGAGQQGNSVTGGFVYRGLSPPIQGHYFFADFASGEIWSFVWDGAGSITDLTNRSANLPVIGGDGSLQHVSGFGEDGFGELYVLDWDGEGTNGELFQLVPEPRGALLQVFAVATLTTLGRSRRRAIRPESSCGGGRNRYARDARNHRMKWS